MSATADSGFDEKGERTTRTAASVAAGALTCIALGLCGEPAQAQGQSVGQTSDSIGVLTEVVVTARRREERLQDVPVSVTAMGEAAIGKMGAQRLQDIAGAVPNFVFPLNNVNARPDISVRGIFSNVRNQGFDVGLGVYLDGVFMGNRMSFNMDLADIERVEFLRGPQGTLFGKNTIAGAINIVSKKPDYDLSGYVEAEAGNYEHGRVRAGANVPLIDGTLAARVAVNGTTRDGYTRNEFNGQMLNDEDSVGGRVQLRFTPTQAWDINLSADFLDENRHTGLSEPTTGLDSDLEPYTVNLDYPDNLDERTLKGVSLSADYELQSGYTLTSVTGWRDSQARLAGDQDLTSIDITNIDFLDGQEQWSQELRLTSPSEGRFDYVAGLYWFRQTADYVRLVPTGPTFLSMFGLPGMSMVTTNVGEVTTQSLAAFGHMNFHLSSTLTAFLGLRYTDEDKDLQHAQQAGAFRFFGYPDFTDLRAQNDATDTSWTAGLRYIPHDDLMVYASVARGFKSGGFNADFIGDTKSLTVAPEFVTNYELGVKSSWLDRRLQVNAAVFYQDYEDLQVTQLRPPPAVGFAFSNAAKATSKGFELEVQAVPLDSLSVSLGVGYTDASFDEFKRAAQDPVTRQPIDFDGNVLPRAPEWTGNAAIQYELPIDEHGKVTSRLDYSYVGSQFSQASNSPETFMPGFGVYNARLGYVAADDAWSVLFWGRNITDKRAVTSAFTNFAGFGPMLEHQTLIYIPPRTYGVTVRFNF